MESIKALMFQGNVATGRSPTSLPENEDEVFSEMLAVLLGLPSPSVDQLSEVALAAEQEVDCDRDEEKKSSFMSLLGMFNPKLQGEQQQEGEKSVFERETPWLEQIKLNTTIPEYFKEFPKTEKPLQQHLLNLKGLAISQETQDKTGTWELQEVQILNSTQTGGVAAEKKPANLSEAEIANEERFNENIFKINQLKDFGETKEPQQLKIINNLEEINKPNKNTIKLKNEVINQEESLTQVFLTEVSENVENTVKELRLNSEYFSRDLPEIVLAKLKTFENRDGSKDVIIHLEPKELGKLVVKLTLEKGTVSAKFVAHYPVTRDLLESGLSSLRQSFTEQGISFDRLDVELGGQQLDQSPYRHQQQLIWSEGSKYGERSGGWGSSYLENALLEAEPRVLLKTGTYDYLV